MKEYSSLGFTEQEKDIINKYFKSSVHGIHFMPEGSVNIETEAWQELNEPMVLSVVERHGPHAAILDTGYGNIGLLNTESGLSSFTLDNVLLFDGVVVVDVEYYSADNFIFVPPAKISK